MLMKVGILFCLSDLVLLDVGCDLWMGKCLNCKLNVLSRFSSRRGTTRSNGKD